MDVRFLASVGIRARKAQLYMNNKSYAIIQSTFKSAKSQNFSKKGSVLIKNQRTSGCFIALKRMYFPVKLLFSKVDLKYIAWCCTKFSLNFIPAWLFTIKRITSAAISNLLTLHLWNAINKSTYTLHNIYNRNNNMILFDSSWPLVFLVINWGPNLVQANVHDKRWNTLHKSK